MAYNKQYKDDAELAEYVNLDTEIWWMFYVSRLAMRPQMPGDRFGCMALTALVKAMQLFL